MDTNLSGKRAIVCGSSQGIGRAAAVEIALLGATVTLVARREAALHAVRDELSTTGGQMHSYIVVDFSDPAAVRDVVTQHIRNVGPVHILVNNTGGPAPGPVVEAEPAEFASAFAQHLLCNHLLAQLVIPGMRGAGYGRIVNIISMSVKQPIPDLGVSNAVRGAVASWAKTLAGELAPYGITVNNILPGMTRTSRLESVIRRRAAATGRSIEEIERQLLAEIPAGRFGHPHELAAAVGFLCSPSASYITGVSLLVDGGRTSCL